MPIQMYECSLCGYVFDIFFKTRLEFEKSTNIICPRCGGSKCQKVFGTYEFNKSFFATNG